MAAWASRPFMISVFPCDAAICRGASRFAARSEHPQLSTLDGTAPMSRWSPNALASLCQTASHIMRPPSVSGQVDPQPYAMGRTSARTVNSIFRIAVDELLHLAVPGRQVERGRAVGGRRVCVRARGDQARR